MRKLNGLYLEYADWLQRQSQSFLDSVKTIQVVATSLVPQEISSMKDFRKTLNIGKSLNDAGKRINGLEKVETFLDFWVRFCDLKEELELDILLRTSNFCRNVTALRREEVKTQIDWLEAKLNEESLECFDFTNIHKEKTNIYTHKLSVSDQRFMGLAGYIPHLLHIATRICYMIGKIYVEVE